MQSMFSQYARAVVSVIVVGLCFSCRKPQPNEHVRPLLPLTQGSAGTSLMGTAGTAGLGAVAGADGRSGASASDDASAPTQDAAVAQDAAVVPPTPPFTKQGLLAAIAECAQHQYEDFLTRAQALHKAADAFASNMDNAHATQAQDAWRMAMGSWQRAEVMRFGPAAPSMEPGGQGLRDQIYIFPLANPCKVDQQLVSQTYAKPEFASTLSSARGLAAIEYLLFHTALSNACLPALSINASGTWAALSEPELAQRRADYAAAAAKNVLANAQALADAWDPNKGNFGAQLSLAGESGQTYALAQDAFNAVSDGMFYIEKEAKDWKIAWPLGLVAECNSAPSPCPNDVESRYARVSTDNLRQNLIGFRMLFEGCGPAYSGLGFDDWLVEIGASDLSVQMLNAIQGAQQAVDSLSPPLEEAVISNPTALKSVHTAIKAITDPLKTQFVSMLDLELPMASQGDND